MDDDPYMDEEARSITKCCYDYMEEKDDKLVCRSCKKPVEKEADDCIIMQAPLV